MRVSAMAARVVSSTMSSTRAGLTAKPLTIAWTQRRRDPPEHARGELGRQVGAPHQRLLEAVDAFRLRHQVVERALRQRGILVAQQCFDRDLVAALDDRVADVGAERCAHRDREQVLARAMLHDLDQVGIAQHRRALQDRPRHLDLVVRQHHHEIDRGAGDHRETLGEALPHVELELAHQLLQDLADQLALALGEPAFGGDVEVGDVLDEGALARARTVMRQAKQLPQRSVFVRRARIAHEAVLSG
jgi:hypothetical protein